jgi:presenilin 1
MLALYDLCAVLTPCGPLKALVNLMSKEDSPEMPGLLYEAELPAEARRPGPAGRTRRARSDVQQQTQQDDITVDLADAPSGVGDDRSSVAGSMPGHESVGEDHVVVTEGPLVSIPLAVALVYNLPIFHGATTPANNHDASRVSAAPLLDGVPSDPTPEQLRTNVMVRLPATGGRIERKGRGNVYLERDRFGVPKRTLWVDRQGKVFMETEEDEDGGSGKPSNSIRLGLGDFIFYSVLVGKAAQYSFATFAACTLVILSGLGGTLVLLSVYHHALPALPISIFLGVVFYLLTRIMVEPWIEAVLKTPFYV